MTCHVIIFAAPTNYRLLIHEQIFTIILFYPLLWGLGIVYRPKWNNLKQHTLLNTTLTKNKTPVPKYYYSKNRKAQILHTWLRTNCSSLNLDLFLKGITDSPLCRCGSIENSQHFFFHCPYYQQQRNALLNVVSTYHRPTLDLLLYGESSLSYDVNMLIFENIHRFILNCKRFSWDVSNTDMVMRLLYYIYPLQTVLYSILDAGCPDPSIPISHLPPSHLPPSTPPPHRPLYCPFTFS